MSEKNIVLICEKPNAARVIAKALAEKGLKENVNDLGVKWYEFIRDGRRHLVVAAVGHLFTLRNTSKGKDYPIFDIDWVPSWQASKFALFTKKYFDVVQEVVKQGDEFVVATDFDTEGSLIGYNILRFLCEKKNAKRMKFSTMTKEELIDSYANMSPKLDFGQIESGLARHYLDHMWGVSISRALIYAIKTSGRRFQIISTGRVQGPSVSFDEDIIVENSNELKFCKIGEFVDKIIGNANEIKIVGDCEVVDVPFACKTYVFNPRTFGVELKPVTQVIRHRVNEPLYKVVLESGKTISVTASHSLFALKECEIKAVETENLNVGDFLIVPTKLPYNLRETHIIDLFKNNPKNIWVEAELNEQDFYVILSDVGINLIRQKRSELGIHANSSLSLWKRRKQKARWSVLKKYLSNLKIDEREFLSKGVEKTIPFKSSNRVMLNEYFSNKDKYKIHDNSKLFMKGFGRGSEWKLFANTIFDETFARLLGYFIAEGSFVGDKALCIDFGPTEFHLAKDASKLIKRIFNKRTHIKKTKSSLRLYFGGRIGFSLFDAIGVYNKSKKKIIPNIIFNSAENVKMEFLKGLFEGDGYFDRYSVLTIGTASKDLASAIIYLLVQLGLDSTSIKTRINKSTLPNQKTQNTKTRMLYEIKIQGKRNIEKLIDVVPSRHKNRVYDYLSKKETKTFYGGIPLEACGDVKRYCSKIKKWREIIGKDQLKEILTKLRKKGIRLEKLDNLAKGNISFLRIKKIEIVEPRIPYVYDLATNGYENFLCGFGGVFAHNTLHMLSKHEKKITIFKSKPFWQIIAEIKIGKNSYKCDYAKDRIWDKGEADNILKKTKAKKGTIEDIKKKQLSQKPPKPYNTTSFMSDVYRYFGYSPIQAMSIAEALYQAGLISYPRTSSEKLPPDINYKKIITNIGKNKLYEKETKFLLSRDKLVPEEGSKIDAAHPAIYPTGELPKKLGDLQRKVYDLVIRRFLSCFGDPAKRESQTVAIDIGGEKFFLHGTRTLEAGWTSLYGKYAARDEIILPDLRIGESVDVSSVEQFAKQTQPPARFSQGSVIKEMENRGLGTKATRQAILQILYNRGYIIGRSIEVTDLGTKLSDILEKSVPDIVSEKLTRHFEKECEEIETGKLDREKVIDEAKKELTRICNILRKKEKAIGKMLADAIEESQEKQNTLGKCPQCGGVLKVHKLWATGNRFVGCTGYKAGCKFSAPLPRMGTIMPTDKVCEDCKSPIVQIFRAGARPFRMCVDIRCPTKKEWFDKKKLVSQINRENKQKEEAKAVKLAAKQDAKAKKSGVVQTDAMPVAKGKKVPARTLKKLQAAVGKK